MSGWTLETLKSHFDMRFEEKEKALAAALAAAKEATALALMAVKDENKKTESAAEKRFELLNELRSGVATKEQLEALEKTVEELKIYKAIAESKAESWLVWVGLFFTGAAFFISIYNAFLK